MKGFRQLALIGMTALVIAVGTWPAAPAQAAPQGYDHDLCANGFVWRDVVPGDHVCVDTHVRDTVATENYWAGSNWVVGAYGEQTCKSGLVWRTAYAWDLVCVSPQRRDDTAKENREWCHHTLDSTITTLPWPIPPPAPCSAVPFNPKHSSSDVHIGT